MLQDHNTSAVAAATAAAAAAAAGASGTGKSHVLLGAKGQPGGLLSSLLDDVFARFDETTCAFSISVEELHNVSLADVEGLQTGGGDIMRAAMSVAGQSHACTRCKIRGQHVRTQHSADYVCSGSLHVTALWLWVRDRNEHELLGYNSLYNSL
jgi:hypothetical protein